MAYNVVPYGPGMVGNESWVQDQRPKDYREALLYLKPNGTAPLFAMTSRIPSERTTDPEFNWWEKHLPTQGGAVTNLYNSEGMGTAWSSAQVFSADQAVFAKVGEALAKETRPGHIVLLRTEATPAKDVRGRVTHVSINGANSRISVVLMEGDGSSGGILSTCDRLDIIGNMNAEGAPIPEAISYSPHKFYNYTQIFRTPLSITRTAMKTRLRTGDAVKEMRREALEIHGMEIEKSLLYGIRSESIDPANGQPIRTTLGLIPYIQSHSSANYGDFAVDHASAAWASTTSLDWLEKNLEKCFRYGSRERWAFAGSEALLGIQRAVRSNATMNIESGITEFGTRVSTLVTAFGSVHFQIHPLFSFSQTNRRRMVIFEPSNFKERFIDKTHLKKDDALKKGGATAIDGIKDEYLTEMGLEFRFAPTTLLLDNVGSSAGA